MSAIVQLSRGSFKEKYLPMTLSEGVSSRFSEPDWMGVCLSGGIPEKLTGVRSTDDEVVDVLKVGGYYKVSLASVKPSNYQCLVSINPELMHKAIVQSAQLLNPGASHSLDLFIQPLKQLSLKDFSWLVQLNLID